MSAISWDLGPLIDEKLRAALEEYFAEQLESALSDIFGDGPDGAVFSLTEDGIEADLFDGRLEFRVPHPRVLIGLEGDDLDEKRQSLQALIGWIKEGAAEIYGAEILDAPTAA